MTRAVGFRIKCEPFDRKFSVRVKSHGTDIPGKELSKIWSHQASLLTVPEISENAVLFATEFSRKIKPEF